MKYRHLTKRQWEHVLWSDESKFNLFSDGALYIRRPINQRNNPRYTIPTVKHGGGNVMLWGCFLGGKIGPLCRVEGTMKKEEYVDIMQNTMLPWARVNCPVGWHFQQDNDPKHTAGLTKRWFATNKIKVRKLLNQ